MNIFGNKKPEPKPNEKYDDFVARITQETELKVEKIEHDNELNVQTINKEHELEVNDLEFKMNHLESEEVKTLTKQLTEANTKISVFEKEIEMMKSIVDLNADIVDVKDIINKLFDKLPTLNIDTISVGGNSKNGK